MILVLIWGGGGGGNGKQKNEDYHSTPLSEISPNVTRVKAKESLVKAAVFTEKTSVLFSLTLGASWLNQVFHKALWLYKWFPHKRH